MILIEYTDIIRPHSTSKTGLACCHKWSKIWRAISYLQELKEWFVNVHKSCGDFQRQRDCPKQQNKSAIQRLSETPIEAVDIIMKD